LRDENSLLKRTDKNLVVARDVVTATATPVYKVLQEHLQTNRLFLHLSKKPLKY
jgi:DNA-directed RNA polymerase subunit beta'